MVKSFFTGKEQKLDCIIYSALGQLLFVERRLAKNESLKLKYSDRKNQDLAKSYIPLLQKAELERQDVWYLPDHPVVNTRKPEKARKICNAAKKVSSKPPERRFDERILSFAKSNWDLVQISRKACCTNCRY